MQRCQNVFLSPLVGLDIFLAELARTEVSSEETFPTKDQRSESRAMRGRYPLVKKIICVGVHRVTDLQQFSVRISKDEASFDYYLSGRCERKTVIDRLVCSSAHPTAAHLRGIFVVDQLMVKMRLIRLSPQWSVRDVRDLRHGSRAYFEIKTSRRNSACISSFVNILSWHLHFIRFKGHVMR